MDGIAVYLLIGNSQPVFCYPELHGGGGGGGGEGVHDTPCVLGPNWYFGGALGALVALKGPKVARNGCEQGL